jgi:Secretion system C-terminal sorting domain/SprB repeat
MASSPNGNNSGVCTATTTVVISQPALVTVSAIPTNVTCFGLSNGSIAVTSSVGSTVTINGSALAANYAAGSYTVMATAANGNGNGNCTSSVVVVISQSNSLIASVNLTAPILCNGSQGVVTVSSTGGTLPLSGTGTFNPIAGMNTYTVTDANGCSSSTSIVVTQPSAISLISSATNASCAGTFGSITASATGGTSPIVLTVNGSPVATSYLAGTYTVLAVDNNNCSISTIVTIINAPTVAITGSATAPLCFGSLGKITFAVSGGASPIVTTMNGSPVSSPITNLNPGSYTITSIDANNCATSLIVTIGSAPSSVMATTVLKSNVICSGGNTGVMQVNAAGGTAPYNFVLNPSGATSSTGNFTNLTAGAYTVTILDANNCAGTTIVAILQPSILSYVLPVNTNPSACVANSGETSVWANGGTGVKTYSIAPGSAQSISGTFGSLTAGVYTVTATDVNGCFTTTLITLVQQTVVALTTPTLTNPGCVGSANGSVAISSTGGSGGFTYTINPTKTQTAAGTFIGLEAGSYTLTSKDSRNCTGTTVVVISNPAAITFAPSVMMQPTCNGSANGGITVSALGGTAPFTYVLTPTGGIQPIPGTFANLTSKIYIVKATDANGCTKTTAMPLAQPAVIKFSSIAKTNVNCNGQMTGAITALTSGGVGAKVLTSAPSGTVAGTTISGLGANTYTLTATDANSCTKTTSVVITQATAIVWYSVVSGNPTTVSTGSIVVSANGGTGTKTYAMAPMVGTQAPSGSFSGLAAGVYTMTASDTKSCSISTTVTLTMTAIVINNGSITILNPNSVNKDIKVYPNPTPGPLNVVLNAESDSKATIHITDASGKRVKTIETILFSGDNEIKLDVRELPNGVYMLQVNTSIGENFNKVINKN